MNCNRREFVFGGIGASVMLATDLAFGGELPPKGRKLKGFAPLAVKKISIKVGAKRPFKVMHLSDTHIVRAVKADGDAKIRLAAARFGQMGYGEHYLWEAVAMARADGAMLVHTATIIFDFFCSLSRTLPFVSVFVRGKEDEGLGEKEGRDVHNFLGMTGGFAFHAISVKRLLKNANAASCCRHRRVA